jgi:hypothetical protein
MKKRIRILYVNPMKKRSAIPVIEKRNAHYPREAICLWCKKRKVMEPHSMAILSGGALAKVGRNAYSGPTKGLKGNLSFVWHGAHDSGEGDHRNTFVHFDITCDVEGGLFNLMFCSVKCLREFLSSCLDEFERRVKKAKPLV